MMKSDTIASIATALSNAGIGIIRISGEDAFIIANKIFQTKTQLQSLLDFSSHTIHYGFIHDDNEILDEVMITVMYAPHTFTTEHTVEINCHGGVLIMKQILDLVVRNGARIAEPGEFTKRAFLNGRIDLSKAEAIMDFIHAKNELALKSSMKQLSGSIYNKILELRASILYEIAFIESALDDPEHISLDGYMDHLSVVVEDLMKELTLLYDSNKNGKLITEGIKTVILGKPNAGKSSLLNYMVGEEKAIVTDIAGTTRDILEQHIMLDGISLHMVDTAGIRNTDNVVEQIGVARSREQSKDADLIIYMIDASMTLDQNDFDIMNMIWDQTAIIVLNKSDLTPVVNKDLVQSYDGMKDKIILELSLKEQTGIEQLLESIKTLFHTQQIQSNDEIIITNMRHKELLYQSLESLNLVQNSILMEMPEDFLSIDLMSAYADLGHIIGEEVSEDLINEIFSKFCTGK